jgi:hypothetical protein
VDDELSDYLETSIRQRVGRANYHTRERFLSEFVRQETDELVMEEPQQELPRQGDTEGRNDQINADILDDNGDSQQEERRGAQADIPARSLDNERHDDTAAAVADATMTTTSMMEDRRDDKEKVYVAYVPSTVQYHLCIKMVSSGLSFRQTSRVMQNMKDCSRLEKTHHFCYNRWGF